MELTSGEVLYRANNMGSMGRKLYPDISEEFWQFLDTTVPPSASSEEMLHSAKCITASVESYILKLRHRILTVRKAIENMKQEVLNQVQFENFRVEQSLNQMQKRFDAEAMQLVLQYYAIIQQEIATSRRKLVQENAERDLLYKQAAVLRDIRLFACHLMVESRGKLSFSMLPPDSQQFARCVKAVMDNVQDDHYDARFRNRIRVLNVFKLQNTFLSAKLQAASERVQNGKIKGLFCCLPQEQFYAFSVFGLSAQIVPYKAVPSLSQLSGEVFSTAWFHAEPPAGVAGGLRQNSEIAGALKVAGSAARLAVQRVALIGSDPNAAQAKPPKNAPHIFRFSRYSTISNLHSLSFSSLEGGVFLALCRVLVVNQLSVDTAIGDADIMAALQQNCDCIYSSTTEEYVLLQPKFVLPEFFMHVQFPADLVLQHTPAGANGGPAGSTAGSAAVVTGAGGPADTTRIPAMLSVDPAFSAAAGSPTKRDANRSVETRFPLENLLLSNVVGKVERDLTSSGVSGVGGNSGAKQSQYEDENDAINLQVTLLRKQAIVENLHRAVQAFKREKDELLVSCARQLALKTIAINKGGVGAGSSGEGR